MRTIKRITNAILIIGAYLSSIFLGSNAAMYYYNMFKIRLYEYIENHL